VHCFRFRDFPALLGMIHHNILICWDGLKCVYLYIYAVVMFGIVYWDLHKQSISDPWQMVISGGLTARHPAVWYCNWPFWSWYQLRIGLISAPTAENGRDSMRFVSFTRLIRKNFKCPSLLESWRRLPIVHDCPAFILGHRFVPTRLLFLLNPSDLIGSHV
jgi:hypothetical protein